MKQDDNSITNFRKKFGYNKNISLHIYEKLFQKQLNKISKEREIEEQEEEKRERLEFQSTKFADKKEQLEQENEMDTSEINTNNNLKNKKKSNNYHQHHRHHRYSIDDKNVIYKNIMTIVDGQDVSLVKSFSSRCLMNCSTTFDPSYSRKTEHTVYFVYMKCLTNYYKNRTETEQKVMEFINIIRNEPYNLNEFKYKDYIYQYIEFSILPQSNSYNISKSFSDYGGSAAKKYKNVSLSNEESLCIFTVIIKNEVEGLISNKSEKEEETIQYKTLLNQSLVQFNFSNNAKIILRN